MSKSRKKKNKGPLKEAQLLQKEIYTPKTTKYPKWTWIILFVLPFVIYWPTYNYGFVLDDIIVLSDNAYVKEGFSGIGKILSTESFQGYFGEQKDLVEGARYRPLSLVTFAIEYGIYGAKPGWSHLINILFYSFSVLLLFQTIKLFRLKAAGKWWMSAAFLTALIFLVHPLHVEAVANVKGRDEIMAFIGSFGALLLSLKFVDTKKWIYLIASCLVFFLGLLAKENTITFLAIIPLSIYFFRDVRWTQALKWFGFLMIPTLIYLATRYNVIGYFLSRGTPITDIMNNPFAEMNNGQKYATIFYTLGKYLQLHIAPFNLTHDYYPYHIPIVEWSSVKALLPLILHLILVAFAFIGLKSKKVYAYCIWFYLAALSIVSNLVVGVGTFMNERFMFTASAGLCLLFAFGLSQLSNRKKYKSISVAIAAITILAFGIQSSLRVPAWKDALSLNTSASKVSHNSARMNSFMATALYNRYKETTDPNEKQRLLKEADGFARKAIEILPKYKNANLMLAGIASEQYRADNDINKILASFKLILQNRPDVAHVRNYLEYLNGRGIHTKELVDFYQEVGNNVLIPNRKLKYALHFLTYGYNLNSSDNRILEGIAKCYELQGDNAKAFQFRSLKQ